MDFMTDKGRIPEKDRDPRVLTSTLDEMALICKSAEFYIRFVTKKVRVCTYHNTHFSKKIEIKINEG
jgi:hypothetical protein